MANAALYFNPEAYDTSKKALMGRHSAGESFLKGYIRNADAERFHLWNTGTAPVGELEAFVRRLEPTDKPISWIGRANRNALGEPGAVHLPTPHISREAWSRETVGRNRYSITGLTHTTATERVMDAIAQFLIAPVMPWDALICTSRAVRSMVEAELEAMGEHLKARLDPASLPAIRLETIPLGVNVTDFAAEPGARGRWRTELGIPDDALVALYMGRFAPAAKMNPVPMAMALERAAQQTGKAIYWVVSGWAPTEDYEKNYHEGTRKFCPSINYITVDGRRPEVRFSIWAVADLFISLSDNIQESFGLTPVEAMASGLPSVISDWDGYKDLVRHEIDGFRISSYLPRPGIGGNLALRYAEGWDNYDSYVGSVSQVTAIDIDEATEAIVQLVTRPELRARMGEAARRRALAVFDWSVIIPRYQALWQELEAVRKRWRPPLLRRQLHPNPARMDPFALFSSYPSEALTLGSVVAVAPGATADGAVALLETPIANLCGYLLPNAEEIRTVFATLELVRQASVRVVLDDIPERRRPIVERGLLWLAKYGQLKILSRHGSLFDAS